MKNDVNKYVSNNFSSRYVILCDFDGTVTQNDVTDEILKTYGNPRWAKIGEQYLKRKISHGEMNICFSKMIKASDEEISNLVEKKIKFREGFSKIVEFTKKEQLKLIVISSGWDLYIKKLLEQYNPVSIERIDDVLKLSNKQLPIISNKIENNANNQRWKLYLKWEHIGCSISSPCKAKIALHLKKLGFEKIVAIGNSNTDICVAKVADLFFTTDSLTDICNEKKIVSQHFTNFEEVVKILENLVSVL